MSTKQKRITLDLDEPYHKKIKHIANHKGISMKQVFINLLESIDEDGNPQLKPPKKPKRRIPKPVKLGITDEEIRKSINDLWTPKY